jgi:hypothetical protein
MVFCHGYRTEIIQTRPTRAGDTGLAGVVTLKAAAEGRTCQKLQVSASPLGMSKISSVSGRKVKLVCEGKASPWA